MEHSTTVDPATVVSTVTVPVGEPPAVDETWEEKSDHVPVDNRRRGQRQHRLRGCLGNGEVDGAEVDAMKFVSPG